MCGRGAKLYKPKLTGKADRTKKGSRVWLKLAIGLKSDVRYFEAALYRLKGELTLQQWEVESQKSKGESKKAKG